MDSPLDDETMEETEFYCVKCGSSKDLYTLEQKNTRHQVIGVIFVCGACSDSLTGKTLKISFGDEPVNNTDVDMSEYDSLFEMNNEITGYEIWN